MSYEQIRRTASAKAFIAQREREWAAAEEIKRSQTNLEASRRWLDEYMAVPRRTSFNWEPRYQFKKPEIIDGQVSDYPLITDQSSGETQEGQARSFSDEESLGNPAPQPTAGEASWTDEAYPDGRVAFGEGDTPF